MIGVQLSAHARSTVERFRTAGHRVTIELDRKNGIYVARIYQFGIEDCYSEESAGTAENAFWQAHTRFGMNTKYW